MPTIGRFGAYEIAGRLALGGMAEILLARESIHGAGSRYLVVKRILQQYEKERDFVDMFFDEARVVIRLTHPNICHIYKFGQEEGTPFIAMEWVNGEALGRIIRRAREHGGIPIPIVCHIIARTAEALHHAHDAVAEDGSPLGLVHRDVTPHNIMVSYDGSVKLLDFGIAKAEHASHKTQAGVIKGKFAYMAPEQIEGADIDRRVDVFALGVCLFEALTGKALYHRNTQVETMKAIALEPVPRLRGARNFDPELDAIVQKALAKAASERYRTTREMQEALDRYLTRNQHVVNAGHVGEMMRKLFDSEIERGPSVDTTPFGSSYHADVENVVLEAELARRRQGVPSLDLELDVSGDAARSDGLRGVSGTREIDFGGGGDPTTVDAPAGPHAIAPAPRVPLRTRPRPGAARAAAAVQRPAAAGLPGWLKAVIALGLLGVAGAAGWAFLPKLFAPEATDVDTGPVVDVMGEPGSTSLFVRSEPAGARVRVGDELVGTAPVRLSELEAGTHLVTVELDGYDPWSAEVELVPGAAQSVDAVLTEAQPAAEGPRGLLTLETQPPARVFLRGELLGRTPLRRRPVPSGVVDLELEVEGGQRIRRRVFVRPGAETPTFIDLREELE
jgi:serine/threonine-protein kinase